MGTALPVAEVAMATKYQPPKLSKDTTLEDGFRLIMGNVVDHIQANIAPAQVGDTEGIHQLRIGIRRARAALRMYRTELPANMYTRFDRRLRNYGRAFGEARDWDVLMTETMRDDWPAIADARNRAAPEQYYLRQQISGVLMPDALFGTLIDRLGVWADAVQLMDAPFEGMAPKMLDRLARKVHKRHERASKDDPETLHRLRKSAKWLRYAAEFSGNLYSRKKVQRYLTSIKKAMDQLGTVNDSMVAERLLLKMNLLDEVRPVLAAHQQRTLKHVPDALANLKREAFWS